MEARFLRPANRPMQIRVSSVEMGQLRLPARGSGTSRKASRRLSICAALLSGRARSAVWTLRNRADKAAGTSMPREDDPGVAREGLEPEFLGAFVLAVEVGAVAWARSLW